VSEALLRETNRPIADIATACGFNDASHYIKFFRRKKGTTPRQYRSVYRTPVKTK
jgi:transcriptional regulator GlxA family with amidase domain